jgi:sulfate transport system ATP-binding protein
MEVADRVVVMNQGRIEQVGSPDDVYQHPATSFVYHFLGHVNLFHGRVHEGTVRIAAADESEEAQAQDAPAGEPVLVYARPHEMEVERQPDGMPSIEGVVQHIFAFGPTARLEIERADNGDLIKVEIGRERHAELGLKVGERVYVRPLSTQIFLGENI